MKMNHILRTHPSHIQHEVKRHTTDYIKNASWHAGPQGG